MTEIVETPATVLTMEETETVTVVKTRIEATAMAVTKTASSRKSFKNENVRCRDVTSVNESDRWGKGLEMHITCDVVEKNVTTVSSSWRGEFVYHTEEIVRRNMFQLGSIII